MIRGVIFDLDGVLVTTDEMHYRGWARLAEEEGIPFDRKQNERQRGVSRMESLEVMLERATRSYSETEKHAMAERKNAYYRDFLKTLTPADTLPGTREMLTALRTRGIRLAVGSSSRNTPLILQLTGLADAFDAVADGNDITRSKPFPDVFLIAAERLQLPPEDCLVVEDAPAGIEAGRRAGMAVFGIDALGILSDVPHKAESLAGVTVDALLSTPMAVEAGQTGAKR